MKVGGVIAEYNPFHNGHKYQIEQFKREHDVTHIVVVMSGNFVQRGDVAITDKFTRSRVAIQCGADLIVELPVSYALSSAENFAKGGIATLDALNCIDTLSFGSTSDIDTLKEVSKLSEGVRNSPELKSMLKSGITFPVALSKLMGEYSNILIDPNNVLGVEYIRTLNALNSSIKPTTLKRKDVQHDSSTPIGNFASASYIRESIYTRQEFKKYVPMWDDDTPIANLKNLEKVILYRLRTSTIEDIRPIFDVSQGLEYKVLKSSKSSNSLEELYFNIKSKRYTLSRVRRIVLNLLLGISKTDVLSPPPYARILAMNSKGIEILSKAKRVSKIPIGTSLAKLGRLSERCQRFATLESTATDVYNLAFDRVYPCNTDYTQQTIRYDG